MHYLQSFFKKTHRYHFSMSAVLQRIAGNIWVVFKIKKDRSIKEEAINLYVNPIEKCQDRAAERGYNYFAVQSQDECFTAVDAGQTYNKYGTSTKCGNQGVGGDWAQNVYKIVPCTRGIVEHFK